MTEQEYIEEMAKILCSDYGDCKKCSLSNPESENPCMVYDDCERLYNAGYRKQSDVAKEIFEEIEQLFTDVKDGYEVYHTIETEYYCELKKKYTEER